MGGGESVRMSPVPVLVRACSGEAGAAAVGSCVREGFTEVIFKPAPEQGEGEPGKDVKS